MLLFPECKINLGLDIVARRADGFHDLETVMVPVSELCDGLEVLRACSKSATPGVTFTSSGIYVDCPTDSNLVVKAWEAMHRRYGIGGVRIHLHKAIPFGAGLGGGSADAAFTLRGLNDLFALGLSPDELEALAAGLGSDVPFFIRNTPRLCTGRGEQFSPITEALRNTLSDKYVVIIKPDIHISTAEAYSLITPQRPAVPLAERLTAPIESWRRNVANAFEAPLFGKYPVLRNIKDALYVAGALYASMSGSGSAIFGIFPDRNSALAAANTFTTSLPTGAIPAAAPAATSTLPSAIPASAFTLPSAAPAASVSASTGAFPAATPGYPASSIITDTTTGHPDRWPVAISKLRV